MNKQASTEQIIHPEETPFSVSPQEHSHQSILIEVLKIALEPNPIKKKFDFILDYLLSIPHLNFGRKAALFFVEQDSESPDMIVSQGFPQPESDHLQRNKIRALPLWTCCKKQQNFVFQYSPPPARYRRSPPTICRKLLRTYYQRWPIPRNSHLLCK